MTEIGRERERERERETAKALLGAEKGGEGKR
jgi:hypothetical protein